MKIFGHPWIESESFHSIEVKDDIEWSPANSTLLLHPLSSTIEIAKYCQKNSLSYAVEVTTIKEAIFANLLGSKYVVASKKLAIKLMPIAQNYLFDTQVLAEIKCDKDIEDMAKAGVDGVIYNSTLVMR